VNVDQASAHAVFDLKTLFPFKLSPTVCYMVWFADFSATAFPQSANARNAIKNLPGEIVRLEKNRQ
ncbi:MAG: hypothetical protein ACREFE_11975, partial [Limisphaerales bacterium]